MSELKVDPVLNLGFKHIPSEENHLYYIYYPPGPMPAKKDLVSSRFISVLADMVSIYLVFC